ncbi:MAG TPA: acyl-CoA thioesterase [Spongiibacteraceae bacterium]|jgi:acyl-CoA thioesterase YciA|nr:acyl-CoA thioesterase [Spongiibacteraceae bacterium]HUH39144.1 acyl-CoA thioesterase [Spongiibacteraceae bacterium]
MSTEDYDDEDDNYPVPTGELALQNYAMPADTNPRGDIFAGWLVSQMDLAGAIVAQRIARGRIATVAMNGMVFLTPVHVGAVVSCYAQVLEIGKSSVRVRIEVWKNHEETFEPVKVTEGDFIFVSIDERGRTRPIAKR